MRRIVRRVCETSHFINMPDTENTTVGRELILTRHIAAPREKAHRTGTAPALPATDPLPAVVTEA